MGLGLAKVNLDLKYFVLSFAYLLIVTTSFLSGFSLFTNEHIINVNVFIFQFKVTAKNKCENLLSYESV